MPIRQISHARIQDVLRLAAMSGAPPEKVLETLRATNWDMNAAADILTPTSLYVAPEKDMILQQQQQASKVKARLHNRLIEAEKCQLQKQQKAVL